jgi:alkaline phosphatase D
LGERPGGALPLSPAPPSLASTGGQAQEDIVVDRNGSSEQSSTGGLSRRDLLVGAGVLAGASVLPALPAQAAAPVADTSSAAPFTLGVASGDPLPDAVVIWTRLALVPTAPDGGMPATPVDVQWEVARDAAFRKVVRRGRVSALPAFGHSVHVDVRDLDEGAWYFYRFQAMGVISPVGRTRTAPDRDERAPRLRLATGNCQDYQNGYYSAYDAMAQEDLDLVVFLGDYIYEYDPASVFPDRQHTQTEAFAAGTPLDQLSTIGDYRARWGLYNSDPSLQAARAIAPWIAIWSDHEVENNYANLIDEVDDRVGTPQYETPAQFAQQRARAYQVWWENTPARVDASQLGTPNLRIYRDFRWGRLAGLYALDTRQYRTEQIGHPFTSNDVGPAALGQANVPGNLYGAEQFAWLAGRLGTSRATWDVLLNEVMVGRFRFPNPGDLGAILTGQKPLPTPDQALVNLDEWDGYAPFRRQVLALLATRPSPVVLSGDIHATWVNDLRLDPDDPTTKVVATEFVSASITSQGFTQGIPDAIVRPLNNFYNPDARYFQAERHGYNLCTVTPTEFRTDVRLVDSISTRTSPVSTAASWVTAAGSPGATPL